ncbi:hypothetical protein J1605_021175 [Eschrichtius robustus]|uniref:Uncharacterized protein n=1 Tax=Eschrichtius robustus TaxID=9764 RepID=A0AB34HHY8_ESCRO|nr:hypothetical protein J1605_021175 [Eschrichtius robustus]
MRRTARPGPPGRGRLPWTRGLRAPPPPLLLLLALLPLLPAPGAAAAPAPRPPALPPASTGPSVSLYLSEDEVRRLIGEWGRLRRGGQVGSGPGASGRRRPSPRDLDRGRAGPSAPGRLRAPAFACLAGREVWSLPGPRPGPAFRPPPHAAERPGDPSAPGDLPHSSLLTASLAFRLIP